MTLVAGKLTGCGTMLPMSTNLPLIRTMSSPSTVAAAMPTTSTTTSAPRPSVRSFTRCTRASGVGNSFMSITSVAPHCSREVEAQRLLVDRDDLRRALLGGDGGRVDAEAARALDDDDVAELHLRVLEAVEHLAERAVHRRDRVVREHVRHLERRSGRAAGVVLGVAAVAVRVLVEVELHAPPLAVRARVMLAAHAPVAPVARREERETRRDRLPSGAGAASRSSTPLPRLWTTPGELVTGHAAQVRAPCSCRRCASSAGRSRRWRRRCS